MKAADRPIITVDQDFTIEVDHAQWIVNQRHVYKKGDRAGEEYWTQEGFCRDLPACLKRILTLKAVDKVDLTHVTDLLAWQSSIMHSMLDRVLRQEKELKGAIETNGVMYSYHNN